MRGRHCTCAAVGRWYRQQQKQFCSRSNLSLRHAVPCCVLLLCPHRAMGGSVLFQDALASRLNLMGLSRQRLDDFLKAHPAQITPGGCVVLC